ncbi:hypothetical protein [Bradyrhizobium sp. C9]|uniref:hypothetical protein n=1 Tax=Bradyrhizobium sp. C9 TaxID=142585 RepID=UPI00130430A3|nr:hypothetical protein [Bradyrhizobium sp. C9]
MSDMALARLDVATELSIGSAHRVNHGCNLPIRIERIVRSLAIKGAMSVFVVSSNTM